MKRIKSEKSYEISSLTCRSPFHRYPPPQSRIAAFAKFICYTGIKPSWQLLVCYWVVTIWYPITLVEGLILFNHQFDGYMSNSCHLRMCSLSLSKLVDCGCAYLIMVDEHPSSILSLEGYLSLLSIDDCLSLSMSLGLGSLVSKSR